MGQREGGGWWGRGLDRERERRLRLGLAWAGLAWAGLATDTRDTAWVACVRRLLSVLSQDGNTTLSSHHYVDISHQWQKLVSASPESKEKKRRTGHITLHYAVHPGG